MNLRTLSAFLLVPILGTVLSAQDSKPADLGIHGFEVKRMDGSATKLAEFAGKVVLIVNTASQCGLTPQYEGLQKLQQAYESKGFTVLAFPANDFGQQEPGTNDEIAKFCKDRYSVTFPVLAKITVKGAGQAPLYEYLTKKSPFPGEISWNFEKYLVDGKGKVIARFDPRTKPSDPKVAKAIETALSSTDAAVGAAPGKAAITAACKEAGASDRIVMLDFSADWCGWCKKFEAFVERPEIKPIFTANFVMVRVATDHMADGQALYDSYVQGKSTGIPFMVWLDKDGAVLARGFTAKGELIGYPSTPEEIAAFMAIFAKHAKKATPEQVEVVRKTLESLGQKPASK